MDELEKWFLSARYKLSKAKEFLGLGFSKETSETLGNLGLKPKLDGFRQTTLNVGIYGNFITRLEYKGFTVFRGTKKEVEALAKELEEMGEEAAIKYLDELLGKSLDDYINAQNFEFLKLGYKFTHSLTVAEDGSRDILHYIVDQTGNKVLQGISTISKDGLLSNVFEVTIQQKGISTAMYKLLEKIGIKEVEGVYLANGTYTTNYIEFMQVYESTGNKIKAALDTPAGKALNKAFNNSFKPKEITIEEGEKVIVKWQKYK